MGSLTHKTIGPVTLLAQPNIQQQRDCTLRHEYLPEKRRGVCKMEELGQTAESEVNSNNKAMRLAHFVRLCQAAKLWRTQETTHSQHEGLGQLTEFSSHGCRGHCVRLKYGKRTAL